MGAKIDFRVPQIQFLANIVAMRRNRVCRRVEDIGNFFGPSPASDQIGNLDFLRGEIRMGEKQAGHKRRQNILQAVLQALQVFSLPGVQVRRPQLLQMRDDQILKVGLQLILHNILRFIPGMDEYAHERIGFLRIFSQKPALVFVFLLSRHIKSRPHEAGCIAIDDPSGIEK